MNLSPSEQKIPTVVRNEFFYLFARMCMIVSLPLTGYMATRMINKADEIAMKIEKINLTQATITAEMKFRYSTIDDHEARLRKLERRVGDL